MSHLDVLLSNLLQGERELAERIWEDVIPPWCGGFDMEFWNTPLGKELGFRLWQYYREDKVPLSSAVQATWPKESFGYFRRCRARLMEAVQVYPNYNRTKRHGFYVRKADLAEYQQYLVDRKRKKP